MKHALLVVLAALLFPCALAAQSIVLINGKVFTADPAKPWAEAVAIDGKKITAVGTTDEIRAKANAKTRVIDLEGRVVIPGINDAHTHPGFGAPSFGLDLGFDPAWRDVQAALASAVDETPASMWITVTVGSAILSNPNVTAAHLEDVAPGRLVRLKGWTGHGEILSLAAMKALGVAADARDPQGGWFDRDTDGRVNGRMWEYAQFAADRLYAEMATDEELIDDYRQFAEDALRYGITSIQAMPGVSDKRFATTLAKARIPLRVRRIRFFDDAMTPAKGEPVKYILDGTPIEQNAALRVKYDTGRRESGRENFANIEPFVKSAAENGQPLLLHATGDKTIEAALNTIAKYPALQRPRIEHGDGLQRDLFPLVKQTGAVIVLNPSHFAFRDAFPDGQYAPARSLVKAGLPIAIGSDGPLNPFLNMMFAIVRNDRGNRDEALSREETIVAYTRGSAYAEFAEKEKGTIAPGMLADLAVLSQNIFEVRADELPATTSVLTIIDGKVVWSDLQEKPRPAAE
ncbi:MAG TPA: amidohydrolase [Thermoanaerobaculia bacterium]|nr:amidohydrolase [Thermoanaerobaculia bacterium]